MINTQRYSMNKLPCLKVVAYKDRAEVQRLIKTSIKKGETELLIDSLSASMDMDSIRVEVGYGTAIVIDVLTKEKVVDLNTKNEEEQEKEETQEKENNLSECLEINRKLLNLNKFIHFSRSLSKSINGKNNEELRKIKQHIKLAEEKLKDSTLNFNKNIISEMKIRVGSNKEVAEVWFLVTYFVYNVSWTNKYDIRVFSSDSGKNSMIKTYYYGIVTNHTGEDWIDTRLSLSTSEPPIGGKAPKLTLQNISGKKMTEPKKQLSRSQTSLKDNFYLKSMDSKLNELQTIKMDLSMNPTIVTYEIAKNVNILSQSANNLIDYTIKQTTNEVEDDDVNRVLIQQFDVKAEFEYETVPKKSLYVFRKTTFKNKSNNQLLPGMANIFLDNNFTSKCHLPLLTKDAEFQLDLGIDSSIQIEYLVNRKVQLKSGFLGKRSRITFEQQITARNMGWTPIKLKIIDNLPLSNKDDDIKVNLLMPKIENYSPKKNNKCNLNKPQISFDKCSHIIDFNFKLAPNERKENVIKYMVDYPSKLELNFN